MPKKPAITVTDRRIKNRLENPFGQPSTPITLKDPALVCRWCNTSIISDKFWRDKERGWDPVTPDMLADKNQVGAFVTSADGFVTRGERQQEILLCMPREYRDAIQQKKTQENIRAMKMGRQRDEVAAAAGHRFGDQAGEFMRKATLVGDVTDQIEKIHREPQVED